MTGLSLGIDIGTSGIRTAVLDDEGKLISSVRAQHLPQRGDQIDAMDWWRAVQKCIANQAAALRDDGRALSDIVRIGVDGTSGSMVMVDDRLRPITRALMYNSKGFDAEAAHIARHAPETHIAKGANGALARALRLQSEAGDLQQCQLLHQADFVIAQLRGVGRVSDHNNALKLGFDPETSSWPAWFEETDLRLACLPQIVPAGALLGTMASDIAQEFGFDPATVVHAGTTDSIAAFLAAAPLEEGVAVTSLGTTLAVKILSDTRIDDPQVGLYSHRIGNVWLAGGASNTGGGVLAWIFAPEEIERLSRQINPETASELDFYPLLTPGERFPINDPDLSPRMTPRPADDIAYLHGLLESIARIEAQSYAAIADRGGQMPKRLFTAGGGGANETWRKIRERVLGVRIDAPEHTEAAVGTARLVMQQSMGADAPI